jgi:hypothetical protein
LSLQASNKRSPNAIVLKALLYIFTREVKRAKPRVQNVTPKKGGQRKKKEENVELKERPGSPGK